MQISRINFYIPYNIPQKNTANKTNAVPFCGAKEDEFKKKNISSYKVDAKTYFPLSRKPFGVDKARAIISSKSIDNMDENIKKAAKDSVYMGRLLKENLDKKYGKDNYVFVPVGIKTSGAAKTLEIMGQDVRYLPISGLTRVPYDKIDLKNIKKGISKKYQKYLDFIGLNKEKIEQDNRHYIFCGHTQRGGGIERTINTYLNEDLKLPSEKVSFISFEELLKEGADTDKRFYINEKVNNYANSYCNNPEIAEFCGIPRIYYFELDETSEIAKTKRANKAEQEKDFEGALYYYLRQQELIDEKISAINENSKKVPFGVNKGNLVRVKYEGIPFNNEEFHGLPTEVYEVARTGTTVGMCLKDYYDEKYGKDGYVLVSIGTSPAAAAKAMEYMGADVRYLPISGLRGVNIKNINKIDSYITKEYKDFLNSIGLTKEKIENDDKHYVFLDYVHRGKTLKNIDIILSNGFGIDKNKYSCESLKSVLDEHFNKTKHHEGETEADSYLNKCCYGMVEDFCGIPHIMYDKTDKIKEALKKEKTREEEALEYLISYILYNKSLKQEPPSE